VIVVGSRLSDFTTASKTAFQHPDVKFININVAEFDAAKHAALPLVADAKVTLEALTEALTDYRVDADYAQEIAKHSQFWLDEVDRIYNLGHTPQPSQGESLEQLMRSLIHKTWSSVRQEVCLEICISCGKHAIQRASISNTATPVWGTRLLEVWVVKWPPPIAKSMFWLVMGPT